jgi:hypothetical protein
MDDIGDYIYLIIIAIAGLSGLLKKKKEKPTPMPIEEDPSTGMEDVWKDFLPDNPVVRVPEPKESFFEWENKERKIATYENSDDPNTLRAKNKVEKYKSSMKSAPNKTVVEEKVSDEYDIEFKTVEDARTAFIYAEIFNKRY